MRTLDEIIIELLDIDRRINRLGFIYFGKAGFNSDQLRVPRGHPDGGQWTRVEGSWEIPQEEPIKKPWVNSFGLTEEEDRLGLVEESYLFDFLILPAASLVRNVVAHATQRTVIALTAHGARRIVERGITQQEVKLAIKTAQKAGNILIRRGKYGTLVKTYNGSNGVNVVVETSGRNAGKIITTYRNK